LLLFCDALGHIDIVESNREFKLMVEVRGQFKGHLFLVIEFKELGKFAVVAFRNVW